MSFLGGLFGIKQVIVNGVQMPSRGTLVIIGNGIAATDNPAQDQTVVDFDATLELTRARPDEEERHG